MTDQSSRILLINGPNLNLLGQREAGIYGQKTLAKIEAECQRKALELGFQLDCFQSNHEGVLVDRIQRALGVVDLILINPGAYTHTSVAIRDALLAVSVPVIEVHISNIHKRESFRKHSFISDIAVGQIVGMGSYGYLLALEGGVRYLQAEKP
ncbi:MAG: type II 3-dehydroquinate dehydratase [Magnetococcales bacterium]|nr:type II 3-dehydroquinate dehydratase [Magnetococcales bacterium]